MTISTRNKIMKKANELFFDIAPSEEAAISAFLDFSDFIDPCFEVEEEDAIERLKDSIKYLSDLRWQAVAREFDGLTQEDLEVVHYDK